MARWQPHRGLAPFALVTVVIATMVALLGGGMGRVMAQDEGESHPAHIHDGTCAELGNVVFPLTNVSATGMMEGMMSGTPVADDSMAMGEMMGAAEATMVVTSATSIDASLADILDAPHAINVHESEANIGNYIACGEIGGMVMPSADGDDGGTLAVGLRQLNDSGYSGIAVLDGMGDQTGVIILLAEGLAGEAAGAAASDDAEATPAEEAAAGEAAVDIADFAFDPETVEIADGDTITWTNQDGNPHTATAQDRDVLQSGTLQQGDSYSQTFDTAGTYDYFCEFHANMQGTIVVS